LLCVAVVVQAATLGNWFSGLLQRQDQLARWLTMGRPRAYWLTGFFNPQVRYYFLRDLFGNYGLVLCINVLMLLVLP
jgi:hypothetical protein